ncbi:MAG: tetratricopeptide repeat protein [Myxococcales bacterium]|nr:tetratricopeptide repeat protein [Myxococcales bacterium]
MNIRSNDYYEILGIERAAEERDVKRSYFRLVRKFSPENAPEEFKRIREAYEILSNSVSRKDYDSLTQWGDEIGARMKAGQAAMERADFRTAQAEFKHVLVLQPQLAFARDLLGMAFLNAGQPRDAVAQFDLLVAKQPDNAVYHLHKGYGHYAQRQYAQATVAYQRALEIDPADTRVRIALADAYTDTEQFDAALVELDRAILQDGEINFQDFVFLMRKVQVQLLRNRPDLAELELDQIVKILPGDGESKKYVATKIAALAAQLFRMRRSADANRLLARARQLDSRKSHELQFPAKATIPLRQLPAPSQTIIAAMKQTWTPTKINQRPLVGPVLLLLTTIGLGLIGLYSTTMSEALWEEGTRAFMLLFVAAIPVLGVLSLRRLRRVTQSPFGKFTEVHPLYLLQVDIEKLTVWPLVNLHDVALTHHLQNGSYQSTSVRMDFGGVPLHLSIRGQQAAVDWAQNLLDTRHRTLSLLAEGLLDSEEGLDLIPPPMLLGVKERPIPNARRNTLLTYGASVASGLLLFYGGAAPLNAANADGAAWDRAAGDSLGVASVSSYRDYLEQFPGGRHSDNAKEAVRTFYDDARAAFENEEVPGGAAMAQVIDALSANQSHTVRLQLSGDEQWGKLEGADLDRAQEGFTVENKGSREGLFATALKQALADVVPTSGMELDAEPSDPTPASLEVRYTVRPTLEKTTIKQWPHTRRSLSVAVDFDFGVAIGGIDKYHLKRTVAGPARDLFESDSIGDALADQTRDAMTEFGKLLADDIGLAWPAAVAPNSRVRNNYFGRSEEEQRRTREFLQKVILDSRKNTANGL